jgi:hypothetical protein
VILATTDFLNPIIHSLSPQVIGYDFPYLYAKAKFDTADVQSSSADGRTRAICMFNRRGSIERTAAALFLHTFFKEKINISYLTIDQYDESEIGRFGVTTNKYDEFKKLLPIVPPSTTSPANEEENQYQFDEAAAKIYANPMVKVAWERHDDIRHLVSDSIVMLTMETNAEGWQSHTQQVSEKTYKAIKMGMPFINFTSRPGILKHLRSLGFKTFNPIIDESYDYPTFQHNSTDPEVLEKQYHDRFRKLLKELNRICAMSKQELEKLWNDCQPIVLHNLDLLRSRESSSVLVLPIVDK